jgi:hypothetical protein
MLIILINQWEDNMKAEDIKIGQKWKRKDGRIVEITDERTFRVSHEFELTPTGKGRKSWKWDGGIINDLEFVE